ncbi:MAG TPA: glycosyltransferase family A protein [Thermoleophilaceae bacterium]
MGRPLVRVVVRAKDEAAKIGTTLERVAGQTIADRAEVVVVDSGSTDGTVEIARRAGVRVIEIAPESFTYGRSLNVGCRDAEAPLLVALSAHSPPSDSGWLARLVEPFADERVACACGYDKAPDGGVLTERFVQNALHAAAYPYWGYSNSSGAFRAELWREHPFREDMPGTEDKEWAWYWLQRERLVVIDPSLATEHSHSDEGAVKTFKRARAEWEGFAMYLDLAPYGPRDLARDWWTGLDGYPSHWRARLGPHRALRLLGRFDGRRRACNRRR